MNQEKGAGLPEPWLRGTLTEVASVARAVLHALELAGEDLQYWAGNMSDEELNSRPSDIAPVAFHIRHIARSVDRLLTYAEGSQLSAEQTARLRSELEPGAECEELFNELVGALKLSMERVRALATSDMSAKREVGGKRLPTTLGGLLVHVADHTQRHVGQALTTAKIVISKSAAT